MKGFREFLNEGKLEKSSYMRGSHPSRDISFDERKGTISVWINAGSAYVIKTSPEIVEKMRSMFVSEDYDTFMKKYVDKLALDVADFVENEVTKWEKDFK